MCSDRVVTIRSPARQSIAQPAMFSAPVVEWVSAIEPGSATMTAATAARASSIRWRSSRWSSSVARPTRTWRSATSAIARWTSLGSGPTDPALR